jgi:hypothetical protein
MDQRTLQLIQRGLVAAVTVVLALLVITAFMKVIEPSDETATPQTTTTDVTTTTPDSTTTSTTDAGATGTTTDVVTPAICSEPEPSDAEATVLRVHYPCGSNDLATGGSFVYRAVPPTDLVLTTTIRELVKGLDADEDALGFRSPFPDSGDGSFLGVSISGGTAFMEFDVTVFPEGVDTPEGSQIFLSTLNVNVFQFDTVNSIEYRLGGSCDAFWQQLGSSCEVVTRAQWQAQLASE